MIASIVVVVVVVSGALIWASRDDVPAFLNPSQPNGYELLRQIALSLKGPDPRQVTINVEELIQLNSDNLRSMREALQYPAELPKENYDARRNPTPDLRAIIDLGHLANLEGLQCEKDNDWKKAADIYLEIITLGQRVEMGPLISLLMGISLEKTGLKGLERIEPHLRGDDRQKVARELERLERDGITMEQVRARAYYFYERTSPNPILGRFGHLFYPKLRRAMDRGEAKLERIRYELGACRKKFEEANE